MSALLRPWAARLAALRAAAPCANSANSANSPAPDAAAPPIGTNGTIGTHAQAFAPADPAPFDLNESSSSEDAVTSLPASSAEVDFQDREERAAIVEEGAGVPREWAEGRVILANMPPPADWTAQRWARLQSDADSFMDQWAARAAQLGWGVLDIFGVDPRAPLARLDVCGLVPLLGGSRVTALDEDFALVSRGSGQPLRYRRNALATGGIPVWSQVTPQTASAVQAK